MTATIHPFPPLTERLSRQPVLRVIDCIEQETENMAWLRRAGPVLQRIKADEPEDAA